MAAHDYRRDFQLLLFGDPTLTPTSLRGSYEANALIMFLDDFVGLEGRRPYLGP